MQCCAAQIFLKLFYRYNYGNLKLRTPLLATLRPQSKNIPFALARRTIWIVITNEISKLSTTTRNQRRKNICSKHCFERPLEDIILPIVSSKFFNEQFSSSIFRIAQITNYLHQTILDSVLLNYSLMPKSQWIKIHSDAIMECCHLETWRLLSSILVCEVNSSVDLMKRIDG